MDIRITLEKVSKRFHYEWIFADIDYTFQQGSSYAILGHNGSGKSTLMQILSGYLSPSMGKATFFEKDKALDLDKAYKHICFASPYIDLIEEFSLEEAIQFHQKFKPFLPGLNSNQILEILQLPKNAKRKEIRFFSSGMKQRVKLALSILSDAPVLLLDEPTITLDAQGIAWYQSLLDDYAFGNRLVIIASNVEGDYKRCDEQLNILDYKKKKKRPL